MAAEGDDINIVLPSPPLEPSGDIEVVLEPPPAEPMDPGPVQLPDAPWEPVDVTVTPDPPPRLPHDVTTTREPTIEDLINALPPSQRLPVTITREPSIDDLIDALPLNLTFDPTTDAVDPESVPHPVGGPPGDIGRPHPGDQPILPIDTEANHPIQELISDQLFNPQFDPIHTDVVDPASIPHPPEGRPGDSDQPHPGDQPTPATNVIDHRGNRNPLPGEQPVEQIDLPSRPDRPTVESLTYRLRGIDMDVTKLLSDLSGIEHVTTLFPGGSANDPAMLIRWFNSFFGSVGPTAVARFIAEQTTLYSMNPKVSRAFNPFYFEMMLAPASFGHVHTTVDTMANTMQDYVNAEDQARQALPTNIPGIDRQLNSEINPYRADSPNSDGQLTSISEMVQSALVGVDGKSLMLDKEAGVPVRRFDASKLFMHRRGEHDARSMFKPSTASVRVPTNAASTKLARAAGTNGIVPSAFPGEASDGTFESSTDEPSLVLNDDDAYVPFSFTDLRPKQNGMYRSVYFRPFGLNFSISVSPEFEEDTAFGRTDPIVGYTRTVKSFDVSFECHAFSPEDLKSIHQKLFWLQSMAYPSFTTDALLQSGPVLRMRIGDVIASGRKGMGGVLRSLSFDHADALWELQSGAKVTRSVHVSLSFLALHEGPIGFMDGIFGVIKLPSLEGLSPMEAAANTATGTSANVTPAYVDTGKFQGQFCEPEQKVPNVDISDRDIALPTRKEQTDIGDKPPYRQVPLDRLNQK